MKKLRDLLNSRTFIFLERLKLARDCKQTNVHSGATTTPKSKKMSAVDVVEAFSKKVGGLPIL